jgi:hypothetical protein
LPKSWWDAPAQIAGEETTPREWLKVAWVDFTDAEIAGVLCKVTGRDVNVNVVTLQRQYLGLRKTGSGVPRIFAESEYKRYDDPPVIVTDNILVLGDVEAPFHDADWCSDVVALAKYWDIDAVLLAGDFLHFAALSSFARELMAKDEDEVEVSDEIESAAEFSGVLLENFSEVHAILGNHEKRLTRRLGVAARARIIRQLLGYRLQKRFNIYPYYYAKVEASTGTWRVTHPKNSSVIPIRVAWWLADQHGQHVVAAHSHHCGWTPSKSGKYYAAECGCCVDPQRLAYTSVRDSTRPRMQQGAFILRDGFPILLHPKFSPPGEFM